MCRDTPSHTHTHTHRYTHTYTPQTDTHIETCTETHIETHTGTQRHQDEQTQTYTDRHKHISEVYIYPGLLTRVLTRAQRCLCNPGMLQLPLWEADGDHGLRSLKGPERRIRETSTSLSRLVLR